MKTVNLHTKVTQLLEAISASPETVTVTINDGDVGIDFSGNSFSLPKNLIDLEDRAHGTYVLTKTDKGFTEEKHASVEKPVAKKPLKSNTAVTRTRNGTMGARSYAKGF